MAWLKRGSAPVSRGSKRETPEDLWTRCGQCKEIILTKDFKAHLNVCPICHHHFPLPAWERIHSFCDAGSFEEKDKNLVSQDPLKFADKQKYADRLLAQRKKSGRYDAMISGRGLLKGKPIQIGVFDFPFMGGSMGAVVGEKVARIFDRACQEKEPAILIIASGGARMQEGLVSLMQMAKTCAALVSVKEQGIPYISIMTNPTTGGVAASFAMLGDINIGEPGALIGFAGPRVIQQTIGESLPEGFQTSEYLLEHGMLDLICPRDTLRDRVADILSTLTAYH